MRQSAALRSRGRPPTSTRRLERQGQHARVLRRGVEQAGAPLDCAIRFDASPARMSRAGLTSRAVPTRRSPTSAMPPPAVTSRESYHCAIVSPSPGSRNSPPSGDERRRLRPQRRRRMLRAPQGPARVPRARGASSEDAETAPRGGASVSCRCPAAAGTATAGNAVIHGMRVR